MSSFRLWTFKQRNFPFITFRQLKSERHFHSCFFHFSKLMMPKCEMLSIKKPKFWKNTTLFITLTNNYAHAIMKEKKRKTDYLCGLSVFLFTVNKLGPLRKPFHKLGRHVSSGFPNSRKQYTHSAFSLMLSSVFSCLETLMKHSQNITLNSTIKWNSTSRQHRNSQLTEPLYNCTLYFNIGLQYILHNKQHSMPILSDCYLWPVRGQMHKWHEC